VTVQGRSPTEQPPREKEGNSPWCHPYIHESLAKHGTKVKVKITLEHATKILREIKGIVLLFL
jgi:CRISPR/Cas system endoribonuclease Cas6 (RAMP superfamily)